MSQRFVIVGMDPSQKLVVLGNAKSSPFLTEREAQHSADIARLDHPEYQYVVIPLQGGPRDLKPRKPDATPENIPYAGE